MNLEQVKEGRFVYTPWLYALGIVVILALVFFGYQNKNEQEKVFSTTTTTSTQDTYQNNAISTTTYKYENIVFQVVGNGYDSNTLDIFQDEKLVLSKRGGGYSAFGYPCRWDSSIINCSSDSSPAFGVDINGDGNKDFVFADVSGGSGGYIGYIIFELPKTGVIKELTKLGSISGGATFKDLNNDGKLDVEFRDDTFSCWKSSCAESTWKGGTIILSWNKVTKTYTPNLDLMRKLAPSESTIAKQVNFYMTNTNWYATVQTPNGPTDEYSVPWSYALNLIYSGNGTVAVKYLDRVWPAIASSAEQSKNFISEEDFKNQFLANLKQSPYYDAILTLNGGKIF